MHLGSDILCLRQFVVVSFAIFSLAVTSFAQAGGGKPGGSSGGGANPGAGGGGGRPTPGNVPGNNNPQQPSNIPPINQQQNRFPDQQPRPIFFSGKVLFDDGTTPNTDVVIERVCNGIVRPESHTDSKGRFNFELGRNLGMMMDASVSGTGFDVPGRPGMGSDTSGMGPANMGYGGTMMGERNLYGCELRAAFPGYRSDVISLATRRSMDNPDVGTIVLHRLAKVEGTTISLTTAMAPKDAKKAYEKGIKEAGKGKFDEAEKQLQKAVDLYPKYALCWHALGRVQQQKGLVAESKKSFEAAIAADAKYVSPYESLAFLAANEGKWEETVEKTNHVIRLNPVEFPRSYFFNAVAHYNLKHLDEAKKSATEGLKVDTRHEMPQLEQLLASIAADKGDYSAAATHLRTYLSLAPNAKNADVLRGQLSKLESALVPQQKPAEANK